MQITDIRYKKLRNLLTERNVKREWLQFISLLQLDTYYWIYYCWCIDDKWLSMEFRFKFISFFYANKNINKLRSFLWVFVNGVRPFIYKGLGQPDGLFFPISLLTLQNYSPTCNSGRNRCIASTRGSINPLQRKFTEHLYLSTVGNIRW